MKYIDAEKLKKFEEALADVIASSQGLCTYEACKDVAKRESPILLDSLQEETPKDLEEEIREYMSNEDINLTRRIGFQQGYEQAEKDLGWHSVEESLPPIDEEVIVLTDEINETLLPDASFVCVAHIVDPDLTVDVDGILYRPVSYNGWNIPGVKFWMPMPKLEEEK